MSQRDAADSHPFQSNYLETDSFAHAANLALAALTQHEAQLVLVLPADLAGAQYLIIQRETVVEQGHIRIGQAGAVWVLDPHKVFLLDVRVFADQLPCYPTVLGQHQQSDRVDVETARWGQAAHVSRVPAQPGLVFFPLVLGPQQHGCGLIPVFGLTADVADRFVQKNGDALGLFAVRCRIDDDLVLRPHSLAQNCQPAVDAYPASSDPLVRFPAGCETERCHAFGEAITFQRRLAWWPAWWRNRGHYRAIQAHLTSRLGIGDAFQLPGWRLMARGVSRWCWSLPPRAATIGQILCKPLVLDAQWPSAIVSTWRR